MSISGGIKFFEPNQADSRLGASIISASSGAASAPFILDRNKYTVWRSVGSNDTITETIIIDFPDPITITRLFLLEHNFNNTEIQYWIIAEARYDLIYNVTTINNEELPSSFSSYNDLPSSYIEFGPITTTSIKIIARTTQIPNQEKFLNSFVVTNEIGTLEGYPVIKDATKDKKIRKSTLLNGRSFVTKSLEVMRFFIDFKNYPPLLSDDLDLAVSLFERDKNFLTWLCGGRNGDPYFKYQLSGFRLEDLIETQVVNIFKDSYRKNTYSSMVNMKLKLEEAG